MKIKDITRVIEAHAPRGNAEEWDNTGMMLGDAEKECTGVLVCLDCTLAVAEQAKEEGCNLIVSHHPFIFRPLDRLTTDTAKGRTTEYLFANGISVYSAHTNLDSASEGLSRTLADILGGTDAESAGCGCYADIPEESAGELAVKVASALGDRTVKVSSPDAKVRRIYVISGAGGDDAGLRAAREGADALVTGEVKHHVFTEADETDFPVVEFSHYYSEIICCDVLKSIIKSAFGELDVFEAHRRCPYKTLEEL